MNRSQKLTNSDYTFVVLLLCADIPLSAFGFVVKKALSKPVQGRVRSEGMGYVLEDADVENNAAFKTWNSPRSFYYFPRYILL